MNLYKKIIIFFLILLINLPYFSIADDNMDDNIEYLKTLETSSSNTNNLSISSKHAIVLERSTNSILFEKSAYEKTAMASTTKIMTAIIALENYNLSDMIDISSKAANTGGSTLGIQKNTKISLESLLYGLLLRSGNDCAVAIAEHIGGNIEGFAKIMNEKASILGLKNTNFVTPHGLDSENHYTTAYELALLTNYALNNSMFRKIVNTKSITIQLGNSSKTINNTNELLRIF